jgi:hypothetical protein
MEVRNLKEKPHPPKCGCDSWLQHWEINSGKKSDTCSASGCSNKAEVGGHVLKRNVGDENWYIIPICKACNGKHGQEYEVKEDNTVPVGATENCEAQMINKIVTKHR